ncbi:MAG: RidA family protein [Parvularcula sp.]|nr:RidA family protein [Parvularcula sp.]
MNSVETKLAKLGLTLPDPAAPLASYVPFSKARDMLFVSGQLPFRDGTIVTGKLGETMDTEEGRAAAELCALGILAQVGAALNGDFGRLRYCMKLDGFVNAVPSFTEHPEVINGASDLMAEVFCERGRHARAAVGCSSLPRGAAVEVSAMFVID